MHHIIKEGFSFYCFLIHSQNQLYKILNMLKKEERRRIDIILTAILYILKSLKKRIDASLHITLSFIDVFLNRET